MMHGLADLQVLKKISFCTKITDYPQFEIAESKSGVDFAPSLQVFSLYHLHI